MTGSNLLEKSFTVVSSLYHLQSNCGRLIFFKFSEFFCCPLGNVTTPYRPVLPSSSSYPCVSSTFCFVLFQGLPWTLLETLDINLMLNANTLSVWLDITLILNANTLSVWFDIKENLCPLQSSVFTFRSALANVITALPSSVYTFLIFIRTQFIRTTGWNFAKN